MSIVRSAGFIGNEVLAELETTSESNGTRATSIDVGDEGKAFGAPMRREAATKSDGRIVQAEIFPQGVEPIGDKKDEAVEILTVYLDLND